MAFLASDCLQRLPIKSSRGGYNWKLAAFPWRPKALWGWTTIAPLADCPPVMSLLSRSRLFRLIIALLAMIVFAIPTTGAPDPLALFGAVEPGRDAAAAGGHGHRHDHALDSGRQSSAGAPDAKHNHGHNQADHSHDTAGLIQSMAASPAYCQRSWHPQCPWMSVSHAPFLLERPPRTLVA